MSNSHYLLHDWWNHLYWLLRFQNPTKRIEMRNWPFLKWHNPVGYLESPKMGYKGTPLLMVKQYKKTAACRFKYSTVCNYFVGRTMPVIYLVSTVQWILTNKALFWILPSRDKRRETEGLWQKPCIAVLGNTPPQFSVLPVINS